MSTSMTEENGAGPVVISAIPAIIAFALFQTIPLLRDSRESNSLAFVVTMTLALIVGMMLYRRMTSVRDHEYHRMRSQRKLGGLFRKEDSGMWSSGEIRGPGGTAELGPLGRAALERMDQDVGAFVRLRTTDEIPMDDDPPEIEMLIDRIMPAAKQSITMQSDSLSTRPGIAGQPTMESLSSLGRFREWRASRKRKRLERLAISLGLSVDDIGPNARSSGLTPMSNDVLQKQTSLANNSAEFSLGGSSCPLCGAIGAISGGSCQRCGATIDRVD